MKINSLVQFFQNSPLAGLELNIERKPDQGGAREKHNALTLPHPIDQEKHDLPNGQNSGGVGLKSDLQGGRGNSKRLGK